MSIKRKVKPIKYLDKIEYHELPSPDGVKEIKYPIDDLYAVYIGNQSKVEEIAICQKRKDADEKIIYFDLLTKKEYSNIVSKTEIYVQKEFNLLALLAKSNFKTTTLLNGYITNSSLVTLYNALNEDLEYKCFDIKWRNEKSGCPIYLERTHQDQNADIVGLDTNATWIATKIALETSKKIIVISGDSGIGKTTLIKPISQQDPKNWHKYAHAKASFPAVPDHHLYMYTGALKIDYNKLIKGTYTSKHIRNRIKKAVDYMITHSDLAFNNGYLIIDNVDFSNSSFVETVKDETTGTDLKIILISDQKIEDNLLDKNYFNVIQATKQNEETIRTLFRMELPAEVTFKNQTDMEELIQILLASDQQTSINKTNYDYNPKLGLTIIRNAESIKKATNNNYLTIEHLIEGIQLENINMDPKTKDETIKRLTELNKGIQEKRIKAKEKKKLFGLIATKK